jgi:AcrR family transcriptional regulator
MSEPSQAAPPNGGGAVQNETRLHLLDAAEELFAEHGYHGVSLREITRKAGVNIASANYHFSNKDGLYRAVFERRVEPMNQERNRLLAACVEEQKRTGRLDPSAILEAFIEPALRVSNLPGAENFRKLSGRAATDPSPAARKVVYELYDVAARRFVDLLAQATPHLTREDLFWRLTCIYGAMMYVRADSGRLQQLVGYEFRMDDSGAAMRHLLPFLTAGLNLPSFSAPMAAE